MRAKALPIFNGFNGITRVTKIIIPLSRTQLIKLNKKQKQ